MITKRVVRSLAALLCGAAVFSASGQQSRPQSGKFIPTFAIKYAGPKGARPLEETAKFDVLVVGLKDDIATFWGAGGRNSWRSLKALNPEMVILAYVMGPNEYNTADWGELGEGWEWMKKNHGTWSPDPWPARGARSGAYVQNQKERVMNITKAGWRSYWIRTVYDDYWGSRRKFDLDGVDGLFADNSSYDGPWAGRWYEEGTDKADMPAGDLLRCCWPKYLNMFYREAVPYLRERGVKLVPNFDSMGKHPEWWRDLDSLPEPLFAAMDEIGFVCPYGPGPSRFLIFDWESRVRALQDLKRMRVLVNAHAIVPEGEGFAKIDVADPTGMTGWDGLWFAMTSFLMGYNDVLRNAYMNYTVWRYGEYHWLDEFDPRYLHLGKAAGQFYRSGPVYFREFQDGYVVVNPGEKPAAGVPSPVPDVRVLNHANFRSAEGLPEVSRFDLPAHRGIILLKHGRKAGNEDN